MDSKLKEKEKETMKPKNKESKKQTIISEKNVVRNPKHSVEKVVEI